MQRIPANGLFISFEVYIPFNTPPPPYHICIYFSRARTCTRRMHGLYDTIPAYSIICVKCSYAASTQCACAGVFITLLAYGAHHHVGARTQKRVCFRKYRVIARTRTCLVCSLLQRCGNTLEIRRIYFTLYHTIGSNLCFIHKEVLLHLVQSDVALHLHSHPIL